MTIECLYDSNRDCTGSTPDEVKLILGQLSPDLSGETGEIRTVAVTAPP